MSRKKKKNYKGKNKPNATLIKVTEDDEIRRQRSVINKNIKQKNKKKKQKKSQQTDAVNEDEHERHSDSIPSMNKSKSDQQFDDEESESDSVEKLFKEFNQQVKKKKYKFDDELIENIKTMEYGADHIVDMFSDRTGMKEFVAEAENASIQISSGKAYELMLYLAPKTHTKAASPIVNVTVNNSLKQTEQKVDNSRNVVFEYDFDSENPSYDELVELYTNQTLKIPSTSGQVTYDKRYHIVIELIKIMLKYEQIKEYNAANKIKGKITIKQCLKGIISESNYTYRRLHYLLMVASFPAWENMLKNEKLWMKNGSARCKAKAIAYNEKSSAEKKNYKFEFNTDFMSSFNEAFGDIWLQIKKMAKQDKQIKEFQSKKKKKKVIVEKKKRKSERLKKKGKNSANTNNKDSNDSEQSSSSD